MAWLKAKYPYLDLHHILGSNKIKLNDFLLCQMPHEIHMRIENGIEVDGYSFEEQLLFALENLLDYIEEKSQNDHNKLFRKLQEAEADQ
jgi:hypothetical protein